MEKTIVLSAEQQSAIDYIVSNIDRCGLVALAGAAGSGKTTLVKQLVDELKKNSQVIVSAMTNKAALVLRQKGIEAVTFHQATLRPLFRPPLDTLGGFLEQLGDKPTFPPSLVREFGTEKLEAALKTAQETGIYSAFRELGIRDVMTYIERWLPATGQPGILIVDEASMLGNENLEAAQQAFKKVILVGDEYQLPPIKSKKVFWDVPDRVRLTQIHRQAVNSQPLELATKIRTGEQVIGSPVVGVDLEMCKKGVPIIVWTNKTRISLTLAIRQALGYQNRGPQIGEVLVCRNVSDRGARMRGLINNTIFTVVGAIGYRVTLRGDSGELIEDVDVHMEETESGNGIPFRYGYALSCHNSQGSEWPTIMIHHGDTRALFGKNREEAKHWLYTAVTRAKERVIWVNGKIIEQPVPEQQQLKLA